MGSLRLKILFKGEESITGIFSTVLSDRFNVVQVSNNICVVIRLEEVSCTAENLAVTKHVAIME